MNTPTQATHTADCCKRPSIFNMDHVKGFHDPVQMVNRVCNKCWHHWYGPAGAVKQYTKREWDKWINAAFDETSEANECGHGVEI